MTPLAQSNLEHGQGVNISSNIEHVKLPVDHVDTADSQQVEYGTSHSLFF